MNLSEFITWLQSPEAIRVVLVEVLEVGGMDVVGEQNVYLSNIPYTSTTKNYEPIIIGGVTFSELLLLDGTSSVSFGDIEIENVNGTLDHWLEYIWNKRKVLIFMGDIRHDRSNFYMVHLGLIDSITARDRNTLNLILVDSLQKLNQPLQNRKIKDLFLAAIVVGSTADVNKEKPVPILLGEVFNFEPIPCSNVINTLTYKYHDAIDGSVNADITNGLLNDPTTYAQEVIEVRDNGVPVTTTDLLSKGTFSLSQSSYGQITCTIRGVGSGTNISPLYLAKHIITTLGDPDSKLPWDTNYIDINSYNTLLVKSYRTNLSYGNIKAGMFCSGGENKLEVIQSLLSSVGLQLILSSSGLLKFINFNLPTLSDVPIVTITDEDFEFGSILITEISAPILKLRLGYCKNYTVQDTLIAGSIPPAHKELYKEDFIVHEVSSPTAVTNPYNLPTLLPDITETYIIDKDDAIAEATRRMEMWHKPRKVITFVAYAHLLYVELGDYVEIKTNRFSLENGVTGLVVSTDRNWLLGRITIGVLV